MGNSAVSFKAMRRISTPVIVVMILALCASLLISQFWWIVLLAGGIVTAVSFIPRRGQTSAEALQGIIRRKEYGMATNEFLTPESWDPDEIEIQAGRVQNDLPAARVFVLSFLKRFVIGQNTQTAQVRTEFLRAKFEELKLSKGIQEMLDELGLRKGNIDLQRLTQKRDTLKIEVEIAELEKQKDEIRNPPKKETARPSQETRSPEEIRKEKREKIMKDIRDYEQRKRQMQTDTTLSEDSRRRQENIIEKKIEQLHDELEKYI